MNQKPLLPISADQVASYQKDGVLMLSGLFDPEWIDTLSRGLKRNLDAPSKRARVWDRDEEGRTMFWDSQAWQGNTDYERFVYHSPAAEIAGRLMGASTINFYFDAVFVRSPGSQFSTPWHQDEPYWSIEGFDTCTIWMPLVSVRRENALAFVPGSHRAGFVFDQYNFGALNPDGKTDVDQVNFNAIADSTVPDIDADPERYGVISWDMEPGDCVVFNSRILHGGSGKLPVDRGLSVFTSKWLGDDVRIKFRTCGMDPDHSEIMTQHGLKPGDRPGTDLYPEVWSQ
ncbi:MAG: phytanoyl-CoA dioxygenase family protein [Pseudomonadota bacterium]